MPTSNKIKYIVCLMLIALLTVSCAIIRSPKRYPDRDKDRDKHERYEDDRRDRR